ncbi:unnamed protein product [Protopolystoma xenopodis]|uniref:Uncharacterized protein n=1 Tax=Protopolystoma xenopodis TaxID=117903 RepID=A0A3S5CLY7_9PLAT|nr:unnamed protein product [Protopolystoma xenopodis]
MKQILEGRSQQKRMVESRCTAAIWLLNDGGIGSVHETSSLFSGENGLSLRRAYNEGGLVEYVNLNVV